MESYYVGVDSKNIIAGERASEEGPVRAAFSRSPRHAKVIRVNDKVIAVISSAGGRIQLPIRCLVPYRFCTINQYAKAFVGDRSRVFLWWLVIRQLYRHRYASATKAENVQNRCRCLTRQTRRFCRFAGAFYRSTIIVKSRSRESFVFRAVCLVYCFVFSGYAGMAGEAYVSGEAG